MTSQHPDVVVVEDDPAMRDSLTRLLRAEGVVARAFATAEEFLVECDLSVPFCLLADVRLPGISGTELMQRVLRETARVPVILITGHADVPLAVSSVKAGAFDFIEKPFDPQALVATIRKALAAGQAERGSGAERARLAAKSANLSPREREVMGLIVRGHHNKSVAASLGISSRTVEVYRANVMTKMGARNLAELVAIAMRLRDPPP